MTADIRLRGVYVPLITPYERDGLVSAPTIERLCHEYLDDGVTGICALGTTAEAPLMSADEKRLVIETTSRVCVERGAQLIVGAGTNNTAATVEAVRELRGTPAMVAVLVVVPYYIRPSEAGILAHYREVAAASPAPVVAYNIPYRTGRGLGAKSMIELSAIPNVAGVKQAVGSVDADTIEILANKAAGFDMLGGEDTILYPLTLLGASGAIAASAHLCTARFVAMIECGIAGKLDEGEKHAAALLPVVQAGFAEPNPSVFKGVLHAQGRIPTPSVRLPLLPASDKSISAALSALNSAALP